MDTVERKYTAKEAMQSVVEYLKDDTARATQVISIRAISESEQKLFIKMFSHWLHKNRERVFLLADSVSALELMKQRIASKYKGIKIVETATLEEHAEVSSDTAEILSIAERVVSLETPMESTSDVIVVREFTKFEIC